MIDPDPLRDLLREWDAPEPSPELDSRVAAAYRAAIRRTPWWRARISIPVPALAAMVLLAVAVYLLQFRSAPPPPPQPGIVTQLNGTGFVPLPNGEARIVSVKELSK